ncbi:MAG: AAA family ATPase [Candidatus Phytoplasma sp. TWB_XP]
MEFREQEKTTLARAVVKETQLPFFEVNSSIFSQKYKGVAPQMVLDECETIFADLSTIENGSEIANVVNAFKNEITSFENDVNSPIF